MRQNFTLWVTESESYIVHKKKNGHSYNVLETQLPGLLKLKPVNSLKGSLNSTWGFQQSSVQLPAWQEAPLVHQVQPLNSSVCPSFLFPHFCISRSLQRLLFYTYIYKFIITRSISTCILMKNYLQASQLHHNHNFFHICT